MIPGRDKKQDIGKIIVAIDTSGSIDDVIVGGFLSELRRIFETFKTSQSFACKVILWADGPYAVSEDFKINQFNQLKQWVFSSFVSGGTSIDPVVKLLNGIKNISEYVGTVWFTDGQIGDLNSRLPDNFNIFVINGFQSDYTRQFFSDLKKFKPSKQITIVKTSYGL
jgi:predicted metal-dependent peptidase